MSRVSPENMERIKSHILGILYEEAPKGLSASAIAALEARDKEFVLRLLREMEKQQVVQSSGYERLSWRLTEEAYKRYKELL